jgi:hypothetical protein
MEHVAFQYRRDIEKQLGAALPPMKEDGADAEDRTLPPEIEVQLSQLAAQAAAKLLQKDVAEAQAKKAQEQQQDPLIQMQQQELQIKKQEVERKSMKDKMDAAAKADDIRLREDKMKGDQELAGTRLGIEIKRDKEKSEADQEAEGVRLGIDIAKHKSQLTN